MPEKKKEVSHAKSAQVTVEAHSMESIVVRETKMQMNSVIVETKDVTAHVKAVATEDKNIETKNGLKKPKGLGWDNLFIKKEVTLGVSKQNIPALEIEELPGDAVVETYETASKNVMDIILFEYFYQKITTIITMSMEVTSKVFRRKIGFGFITEANRYFKSKAVRVDRSAFFNQEQNSLMVSLSGYSSYSEVYNIWQTTSSQQAGKTFFIFRHFLNWNSLTEVQKKSVTVATTQTVGGSTAVVFVDPIYIDEEYVVIEYEQTDGTWFWVVSKYGNLPVRMRSMFERKATTSLSCSMSLRGLTLFQKLLLGSFSLEFPGTTFAKY